MKTWAFCLFIAIGIVSCNHSPLQNSQLSKKEKIADEVLSKVARQMKQEANLRPCGTMGQMMNEIQKLGLSFFYFQPLDIVEGRKLLMKAAGAMLNEMNQEPRIRAYLGRYPVTPWNIQMEIFIRNPDGSQIAPGNLQVIDVTDGILKYQIRPQAGYGLITIYKETYQEALDRIADPTLPLASFEPDRNLSPEELTRLRKNIRRLSDDGSLYHLGENGNWVKDSP